MKEFQFPRETVLPDPDGESGSGKTVSLSGKLPPRMELYQEWYSVLESIAISSSKMSILLG